MKAITHKEVMVLKSITSDGKCSCGETIRGSIYQRVTHIRSMEHHDKYKSKNSNILFGERYEDIYNNKPMFCVHILNQQDVNEHYGLFQQWLRNQPILHIGPGNTKFKYGLNKGREFREIVASEESDDVYYCMWALKMNKPLGEVKEFKDYLINYKCQNQVKQENV